MEHNKKKGKMVNFRLRKDEDPLIIDWIEEQSNLASAFRYMIRKDSLTHGIRDLAENTVKSEVQALNQTYDDFLDLLPKLKIEQKLALYIKLHAEVNSNFQLAGIQIPYGIQTQTFDTRSHELGSQIDNRNLVDQAMRDGNTSSDNEDVATLPIVIPNQNMRKENQLENKVKETDDNPIHKQEGSESESVLKEEASFNDIENDLVLIKEQIEEEDPQIPIANEDKEAKPKRKRKPSANNLAEFFNGP